MITQEIVTQVGKIFKPHGYKGEMNVDVDYGPELFANPKTPFFVKIDNILVPFFVERIGGGASGTSYMKFKGVNSDIEALQFVRKELYAPKDFVAGLLGLSPEELEMTVAGVVGFDVIDGGSGEKIGTVEDMEEGVEYDYILVRKASDDALLHIPFVDEFVEEITESSPSGNGEITVSLPEGFMESFG